MLVPVNASGPLGDDAAGDAAGRGVEPSPTGAGGLGPTAVAGVGGLGAELMAWAALPTATDCCTWAAGLKLVVPAWLASITQVPAPVKVTTPAALIEHAPAVEVGSMVKTTGFPDPPPVAAGV